MRSSSFAVPFLAAVAVLGAGCSSTTPSASVTPITVPTDSYATSNTPATTTTPSPVPPSPTTSTSVSPKPTPPTSMPATYAFPGIRPAAELAKNVRIKTTKGDIVVKIDPAAGPNAASNFVYLVEKGFYTNIIFHRVIPGFMIQGGDPTGTGRSGPGYTIPDDVVKPLPQRDYPLNGRTQRFGYYPKGTVAMARTGAPNSAGSQFFIMVDDYPLDPSYAIFGHVIEGQDVADAISQVEKDANDRPDEDIKMISVTIEE